MERAKRIDFEFYIVLDKIGEETLYFRPRKDGRGRRADDASTRSSGAAT